jgi:hypothetical protein
MNNQDNTPNLNQPEPKKDPQSSPEWIKVKLPVRAELYHEINEEVSKLSTQLGFKVTLTNFLHKTISDNWKYQIEYYRKIEPNLKRIKS